MTAIKEGSLVKILAMDEVIAEDFKVGEICTVRHTSAHRADGYKFEVYTRDNSDWWLFTSEQLELVSQ